MNSRCLGLCLLLLSPWLRAPEASAQRSVEPRANGAVPAFANPAEADRAFAAATDLPARSRLLLPLTEAYLRAHRYEDLAAKLAAAPTTPAAGAGWQRGFLLAQFHSLLGNFGEAARLLKELPEGALRDPEVVKFRLAHPDLAGNPPERATAALVAMAATPVERIGMVAVLLDALRPDLAMELIAAHPDDLWDEREVLGRLARQIADQGLIPQLTPLLAARVERTPENWWLRLWLAHYQFVTGDSASAWENLQRIRDQKDDASDVAGVAGNRAPTLTDRVTALDAYTLWNMRFPGGGGPRRTVWTLQSARDLALICAGGRAAENGEGPRFLQELKAGFPGDDAGWLATLMLLDSQGLILRELRSQLARGTSTEAFDALAANWLGSHRANRQGMMFSHSGRDRLQAAYAKRVQSAAAASPVPGPESPPVVGPRGGNLPADPAARGKLLAKLEESADATAALWEASRFLSRRPGVSDDAAVVQTIARLMVRTVAQADEGMAVRMALQPGMPWGPAFPGPGRGRRPTDLNRPGGAIPDFPVKQLSPGEEVASAFFARSAAFPWQSGSMPPFRFPLDTAMPAGLPSAIAQVAPDPGAPDHAAARMAEAYVMSRAPGQSERAIELLRRVAASTPSDLARFWLTALLAERGRFDEAISAFTAVKPVPGYAAELSRGGIALLERAGRGEPPFTSANFAVPPPTRKTLSTTSGLLGELRRLAPVTLGNNAPPAPDPRALEVAEQLSALRPAEAWFPERLEVLKVLLRFGKLPDQVALIEERTKQFPASADAWLALGDALSLADPARSDPAYRTAFTLAPDRPDIAEKLVSARASPEDRVAAYCVLLRKDAVQAITTQANLLAVFQQANAWPRFAAAFRQGCTKWGHRQLGGSGQLEAILQQVRQSAGDEIAIQMLTAMCQASGAESSYYAGPENALIALLNEKNRTAEVAAVVDGVLFSSETIHGLDVDEGFSVPLLNPPDGLNFIAKVTTPEGLARLKQHARQLMAERPGEPHAPLVLLTLLAADRDPALSADVLPCLQALRAVPDDGGIAGNLSSLARMASVFPAGKPVALELLAEVRRRRGGTPAERETIEQLATTALDFGDRERAQAALRELLALAKSPSARTGTKELTNMLCLMARAGMAPEASELTTLAFNPGTARPDEAHVPASSFPLTFLEACFDHGQPKLGGEAIPHFLRRLTVDAEDRSGQQRFPADYPARVVEALVCLDRTDDAGSALNLLQKSWQASATPELQRAVETARRFLARVTGEGSPTPVAFVGPVNTAGELTCWWDLAGPGEAANGSDPARPNLLGADLPALAGRYSVQILGGETTNRLVPIATIPDAPSRGEWRGTPPPGIRPASLRFTRVILTGPGHETVIGPSVPVTPGEERLRDPDMEQLRRPGDHPAPWTLPGGALLTAPGPIPARPGLAFVYQGAQPDCEIRGERIPVRPGESFVQSAWLRAGGVCEWGRRYLDGNGRELGFTFITAPHDVRGWTLAEQRLEAGTGERAAGERIPPGTAFIEPVLRMRYFLISWEPKPPVRLAGLSFRSLTTLNPGPPAPANPTAAPAPDHLDPTGDLPAAPADEDESRTRFGSISVPGGVAAVSPESDMVVVGGNDGIVHFLEYPSGKELAAVHAHDDPIKEIAVIPARAGAYSVDTVGNVHLVTFQPPTDTLVACTSRPPHGVTFTPDRRWVIFAAQDPKAEASGATLIEVMDLATAKKVGFLRAPDWSRDLWVSPDGRTLFARNPGQSDPEKAVVSSWELPSLQRLPDATGALHLGGGRVRIPELEKQTLFAADAVRDRYVTVNEYAPLTVPRAKDHRMVWAFRPAPTTSSLAVVPKDGTILACSAEGTLWRYVAPE